MCTNIVAFAGWCDAHTYNYDGDGCIFSAENGHMEFSGRWRDNLMHGVGTIFCPKTLQFKACGNYEHDMKHGIHQEYLDTDVMCLSVWHKGYLVNDEYVIYRHKNLVYIGGMRDNAYHGRGMLFDDYTGTVRYVGAFVNGRAQGFGSAYAPSGKLEYTGYWLDNRSHGAGTSFEYDEHLSSFMNFRGDFSRGFRHGFGTLFRRDGSTSYAGQWTRGEASGWGIAYAQGNENTREIYVGQWLCGDRHGEGVEIDAFGAIAYHGEWRHGSRCGFGTSWQDGTVAYIGQWKTGSRHGDGSSYHSSGRCAYVGQWKSNLRQGSGMQFDVHPGVFQGQWQDDTRSGQGCIVDEYGNVHLDGLWSNDAFDEHATKRRRIADMHIELGTQFAGQVPLCVICREELHHGDSRYAFVPCGHSAFCEHCATDMNVAVCPVCRHSDVSLMRLYL